MKSYSDALRLIRRYLEFIAIPFIGGGLIDLIDNVVTYPNMIQQVMDRGLIYYLILLCVLGLNYFIFYWAIKETTNPWDKSETDTSLN